MQIYEILSACDNVETMYHLNQYIYHTSCRSSPNNRFIIFILIRSVLIGNINIGLIMIENKHTKHASKYGLGSRRCSKISKVIILVIIFI